MRFRILSSAFFGVDCSEFPVTTVRNFDPFMHFFRRPILSVSLLALMTLPAASGPGQTLPDLGDVSQSVMSPAQERKLGESIIRQVHSSGGYLDDPEVEAYLNALGQRLASSDSDWVRRISPVWTPI